MAEAEGRAALPRWATTAFVLGVLAFLAAVMWILIEQNRHLKEALAEMTASAANSPTPVVQLQPGDTIPRVTLTDMAGVQTELPALVGGKTAVLAAMTTICPYCQRSLPLWGRVAESLEKQNIEFFGLFLDGNRNAESYIATHEITWSSYVVDDPASLKTPRVPTTVLLNASGAVEKIWIGQVTEAQVEEMVSLAVSRSGAASSEQRVPAADPLAAVPGSSPTGRLVLGSSSIELSQNTFFRDPVVAAAMELGKGGRSLTYCRRSSLACVARPTKPTITQPSRGIQ